jgi:hypothetical protein
MTRTNKKRIAGSLLFLLILVPVALAVRIYQGLPGEPLKVGATAPRIAADPINGAGPLPQSGRRVLVFFSPSCAHCRNTLAQLSLLREEHKEWFAGSSALQWAFISVAGRDETEAFARGESWPIYHDASRAGFKSMGGFALPYVVMLDEEGLVRHSHKGEVALDRLVSLLGSLHAAHGGAH